MSTLDTLTSRDLPYPASETPAPRWGLTVLWCFEEPHRIGEHLRLDHPSAVLGRGEGEGAEARVHAHRLRPEGDEIQPPLGGRRLSRRQLRLEDQGDALVVTNVGRTSLRVHGGPVSAATLREGELLEIANALVCLVERRAPMAPLAAPYPDFPFGQADPFGIVGESVAAWALRSDIAFVARRDGHCLVHGPSGAGKELVAAALHALGTREGPLVSRNAATFPASLIDAELFGNLENYPNPGMAARPGLIGQAHGGTLLLDELAELPQSLQAHLLRVLDAGEYQRLGESVQRKSDLVFVGLTNRPPESLKHDLRARLRHVIRVPGLEARRGDIPLIATALLRRALAGDPELLGRFFDGDVPRLTPRLVRALVQRDYATHVRELDARLWRAVRGAREPFLDAPEPQPLAVPEPQQARPEPDRDALLRALEAEAYNVSATWRRLGLRNRDQLRRLMKKHGIRRPQ